MEADEERAAFKLRFCRLVELQCQLFVSLGRHVRFLKTRLTSPSVTYLLEEEFFRWC